MVNPCMATYFPARERGGKREKYHTRDHMWASCKNYRDIMEILEFENAGSLKMLFLILQGGV